MNSTRREFIRSVGIILASLMMTRCSSSRGGADDPTAGPSSALAEGNGSQSVKVETVVEQYVCYIPTATPDPDYNPRARFNQQRGYVEYWSEDGDLDPATVARAKAALARDRLRYCWSQLSWLAQEAEWDFERAERAQNDLIITHRLALDDLVDVNYLNPVVADQVQIAFAEAAYHAWRANAPLTCYRTSLLTTGYQVGREELLQRVNLLAQEAGYVDHDVIAQAQAAIERDMSFFEALAALDETNLDGKALHEAIQRLIEQLRTDRIEVTPEAVEAAQYLIGLLVER